MLSGASPALKPHLTLVAMSPDRAEAASEIVTLFFVQSLDLVRSPAVATTPYFLWYKVQSSRRQTPRKSRLQAARARLDDESAITTLLTQ